MELDFEDAAARGLRGYVRLVAEACGAGPNCSFIEWDRPLRAYIAVDGRLPGFPTRDVALWWQEEHGWAAGIETHSGQDIILLTYLGTEALPAPRVVARFLAEVLGRRHPGQPQPPALRRVTDDDLLDRLADYARPALVRHNP
ncbi:MAG TPA: DUF6292 family protein [Actinophytocola sp.]|uniref:DUF6292 family protein n=1 Tax=Actinophytocola sp. TaxID=1872138 RepID=UPI002DDD02C9|nr:DUF6292 family protein [Actinophytocola sp.]HEV2777805.1 DUF6292 family protein [Actinophytocola sp.]